MFTTSPYRFSAEDGEAYRRVERAVRMARYGVDCYGYCMVAAGQADIVVEAGLQSYDIVGLIPVVEEAGGVVTAWDGGSAAAGGQICAAATPNCTRRRWNSCVLDEKPRVCPETERQARRSVPGTKASKAAQYCSRSRSRSISTSWRAPSST